MCWSILGPAQGAAGLSVLGCQVLWGKDQIQLRAFSGSEIRRAGAGLQEEAVQSLCGDLLQLEAGSAESTLVLNTLPWERTEVIARTGPAGTETLGMSNGGG